MTLKWLSCQGVPLQERLHAANQQKNKKKNAEIILRIGIYIAHIGMLNAKYFVPKKWCKPHEKCSTVYEIDPWNR